MIIKAIDKITNEMMAAKGNPAIIYIEENLRKKITSDEVAEKILQEGKTIAGAFGEMRKIARERAVNNVGFIPPEEGLEIIYKYFGIDDIEEQTEERKEPVNILDLL
ncbi:MAG: hypothetical protein RSA49_04185 [Anaerovoracaceae bacterium]|uniref:hypothetical protein n=1 Tax=Chryseobacterium sp. TaxID=1871047 RepID=UPI002FC7B633